MSKQVIESTLTKINRLLGIDDSYKAPERIMNLISDKESAKQLFLDFMPEFDYDLSREWFSDYFEDEHANRKKLKQDFTPRCVSDLLSQMLGDKPQYGIIYEPAAGTGSTVISHWYKEQRKCRFPWDYNPDYYLYVCEELSDKTVPFLLFNLLIRGMNAVVIHGNTLTRKAKAVYLCSNERGDNMCFSILKKLPCNAKVENAFRVKFEEALD